MRKGGKFAGFSKSKRDDVVGIAAILANTVRRDEALKIF